MEKDEKRGRRAPRHVRPQGLEMNPKGFQDRGEEGVIEGRNALMEALDAGLPLDKVYIAKGDIDATLRHIAARARDAGAVVVEVDRRRLDALSNSHAHQGIVAQAAVRAYASVEEILQIARDRGEDPFLVICDEISDPHNLGAIIRTAEAAGVHGIIIPKRRSAGLTPIVQKTSAGAVNHMPVARVPNLTAAIRSLQEAGLWIYGAAMEGEKTLWQQGLTGPLAIVIGSEGKGIGPLLEKHCDFLVKIPMVGRIGSLNASVAAALMLYEVVRQRAGNSEKG